MDSFDRSNSLKIQSSKVILQQSLPFSQCRGLFPSTLKTTALKSRTRKKAIINSVMSQLVSIPYHYHTQASQDSSESILKKVLRGERRQLFSRFQLPKTNELYESIQSKMEFFRRRFAISEQVSQEVVLVGGAGSRLLGEGNNNRDNSRVQENPEKKTISPVKRTVPKYKILPNISFEKNSKQKQQLATQAALRKPVLLYQRNALSHIKSQSFTVIQHPSTQTLLCHNPWLSVQVASLTKIMTFYVILQLSKSLNIDQQLIQVHPHFQQTTGTSAQLIQGDTYTLRQLLYGMMLPSGNDAALCLAHWGGSRLRRGKQGREGRQGEGKQSQVKESVKTFVQEMNRTAKSLGLKHTRYGNPHGLPSVEARSTAADMARLVSKCLQHSLFCEVVATEKYKTKIKAYNGKVKAVEWENTNKLLRRPGFIGVKTGITVTAGPCLAAAYVFREKTYIVILLRTNKISRRFKQTRKILYWTLKNLHELTPQESYTLEALRRNRREFDSDNSEDEHQFVYSKGGSVEFAKRKKILKNQL